jgi:hypothetical protein
VNQERRVRGLAAAEFDEDAERAVLYGETRDGETVRVQRDEKGSASFRGNKSAALNVARQAAMDQAKLMGLVVEKVSPTDSEGKTLDLAALMLKAREDAASAH